MFTVEIWEWGKIQRKFIVTWNPISPLTKSIYISQDFSPCICTQIFLHNKENTL